MIYSYNYFSATFTIKQDHVIRCTKLDDIYYNDIIVHSELFFRTNSNLQLDTDTTIESFINSCYNSRSHHPSPAQITFAAAIPDHEDCDYPIGSPLRSDNSLLKFAQITIDLINYSLNVEGHSDFIEAYYKLLFNKAKIKSELILNNGIDSIPNPYTNDVPLDAYTAISAFTTAIQTAAMKINKLDKPLLKSLFYKKDVKVVLSDIDAMLVHELNHTVIGFIDSPTVYKKLSRVMDWKNNKYYDYSDMTKALHLNDPTTESDQDD